VDLHVGGQTYRVVASTDEAALRRYACVVDDKLRELTGDHGIHPKALLLAAISLAHELEQERERREQLERRSREMLQSFLVRIDAALDAVDENGDPLPPAPNTGISF
jgi:cell division protein ZapA